MNFRAPEGDTSQGVRYLPKDRSVTACVDCTLYCGQGFPPYDHGVCHFTNQWVTPRYTPGDPKARLLGIHRTCPLPAERSDVHVLWGTHRDLIYKVNQHPEMYNRRWFYHNFGQVRYRTHEKLTPRKLWWILRFRPVSYWWMERVTKKTIVA